MPRWRQWRATLRLLLQAHAGVPDAREVVASRAPWTTGGLASKHVSASHRISRPAAPQAVARVVVHDCDRDKRAGRLVRDGRLDLAADRCRSLVTHEVSL